MRTLHTNLVVRWGVVVHVLLVCACPSFAHQHPNSEAPHSHNLGLLGSSCSCHRPHLQQDASVPTRHLHWWLFGCEVCVPAGHEVPPGQTGPCGASYFVVDDHPPLGKYLNPNAVLLPFSESVFLPSLVLIEVALPFSCSSWLPLPAHCSGLLRC